jgi:hypothetical protein
MGRFEDTIALSGKTYQHTTEGEIVPKAKDMPQMATSKAPWRIKKNKNLKRNEGQPYLDNEGNPIPSEVEKILKNKK